MDRTLVNNQIILMRKVVRNVKRLVKQQLNRQIKRLELRLNKNIEKTSKKVENKINNKRKEMVSINGVNVDEVSKQALIQTKNYFEDIIKSSQSSVESKALARIAINEQLEKVVNKFKEDNPNSDQWLPSQIELWQQKKLIKKKRIQKQKGLTSEPNDQKTEESNIDSNVLETNEPEVKTKQIKHKKNIKNKTKSGSKQDIKPTKSVDKNEEILQKQKKVDKTEDTKPKDAVVEQNKPKSDPFFLSNDSNIDEQSENESEEDVRPRNSGKHFKTERFGSKFNKFSKPIAKNRNSPQNFNKTNFKPKKFDTTQVNRGNSSVKSRSGGKPNPVPENMHPSWAAKRSAKDKLKINLNSKPLAKKIKFSD